MQEAQRMDIHPPKQMTKKFPESIEWVMTMLSIENQAAMTPSAMLMLMKYKWPTYYDQKVEYYRANAESQLLQKLRRCGEAHVKALEKMMDVENRNDQILAESAVIKCRMTAKKIILTIAKQEAQNNDTGQALWRQYRFDDAIHRQIDEHVQPRLNDPQPEQVLPRPQIQQHSVDQVNLQEPPSRPAMQIKNVDPVPMCGGDEESHYDMKDDDPHTDQSTSEDHSLEDQIDKINEVEEQSYESSSESEKSDDSILKEWNPTLAMNDGQAYSNFVQEWRKWIRMEDDLTAKNATMDYHIWMEQRRHKTHMKPKCILADQCLNMYQKWPDSTIAPRDLSDLLWFYVHAIIVSLMKKHQIDIIALPCAWYSMNQLVNTSMVVVEKFLNDQEFASKPDELDDSCSSKMSESSNDASIDEPQPKKAFKRSESDQPSDHHTQ